ncbi:hypothetical protein D3C81_1471100 [compost metagenome]
MHQPSPSALLCHTGFGSYHHQPSLPIPSLHLPLEQFFRRNPSSCPDDQSAHGPMGRRTSHKTRGTAVPWRIVLRSKNPPAPKLPAQTENYSIPAYTNDAHRMPCNPSKSSSVVHGCPTAHSRATSLQMMDDSRTPAAWQSLHGSNIPAPPDCDDHRFRP